MNSTTDNSGLSDELAKLFLHLNNMKTYLIVTLIIGFGLGVLSTLFYSNFEFSNHVKEAIFDECFNYYAETDKERGIDKSTIETCVTKTEDWIKELKK